MAAALSSELFNLKLCADLRPRNAEFPVYQENNWWVDVADGACRVNFGSNRAYFTQLQLCALRHRPPTTFATRRRPRPTRDGARVQVHCPLRGRVWPLSSQKSQPQVPRRPMPRRRGIDTVHCRC